MKQSTPIPLGYRPVPNLCNYSVNEQGQVWSNRFARLLTVQVHKSGYHYLQIPWDGSKVKSTIQLHRIVAAAFIPNPDNKPTVNHIDGNKANNCVSNLEWATMSEQIKHGFATGLITRASGEASPRYGKRGHVMSEEAKAKMSAAKMGKHRVAGRWV